MHIPEAIVTRVAAMMKYRHDPPPSVLKRRDTIRKSALLKMQQKSSSHAAGNLLAWKLYGLTVFLFWLPSFLPFSNSSSKYKSSGYIVQGDEVSFVRIEATATTDSSNAEDSSMMTNQTDNEQDEENGASSIFQYWRFDNQTIAQIEDRQKYGGNVLLYLTTDMSKEHMRFLTFCWPSVLEHSSLLRHANVLIYAHPPAVFQTLQHNRTETLLTLMQDTFRNNPSLRIFIKPQTNVYEVGPSYADSLSAMWEATHRRWWWKSGNTENVDAPGTDRYDWVIRLHPDVLVRNDTFLLQTMKDPFVEGIFNDCLDKHCHKEQKCRRRRVHGDAILFRPSTLRKKSFFVPRKRRMTANTERELSREFQTVVSKGADRWIPGTGLHGSVCRIGHQQILKIGAMAPPIVHSHNLFPAPPRCESLLGS
jgi:hypothetical protein